MNRRRPNPVRVQLRRTKGWRMPPGTVKVDRTTVFGNPFPLEPHGRSEAVRSYGLWIRGTLPAAAVPGGDADALRVRRAAVLDALPTLEGKNLACWCPLPAEPGEPDVCHAAILLELVRERARRGRRRR